MKPASPITERAGSQCRVVVLGLPSPARSWETHGAHAMPGDTREVGGAGPLGRPSIPRPHDPAASQSLEANSIARLSPGHSIWMGRAVGVRNCLSGRPPDTPRPLELRSRSMRQIRRAQLSTCVRCHESASEETVDDKVPGRILTTEPVSDCRIVDCRATSAVGASRGRARPQTAARGSPERLGCQQVVHTGSRQKVHHPFLARTAQEIASSAYVQISTLGPGVINNLPIPGDISHSSCIVYTERIDLQSAKHPRSRDRGTSRSSRLAGM